MYLSKIEKPQSFKQHAYEEIKNAIINHTIPQGKVLFERNLSDMLGISRTPLRSAIQMLEMEGWLTSEPRKGVFIHKIAEKDVIDVIQLRRANESLVVEIMVPEITDEEMEKLESIFAYQVQHLADDKLFILTDKDFHMYMAELTGNKRLIQLMQTLSDQMRWFGIMALHSTERKERTMEEHRAILEGIKNRDVELAKKAVIDHIEQTRTAVLAAMKEHEED